MDTINVPIGTVQSTNAITQNNTRRVEFVGEPLACRCEYGEGRHGGITDTRGTAETLYRTEDNRLIVHIEDWSKWQGEPTTYSLHEVTESDLQPNGQFEALGREAGFGRNLTLDEALQ